MAATGMPSNKRVLAYHEAPPAAPDTTPTQQRELVRPLYSQPSTLPSTSGAVTNLVTNRSRTIATHPEHVLNALGMVDDFYLNLLSWSVLNIVALALSKNTYIWRAETGMVVLVGEAPEGSYISSVDFSIDGAFLGVDIGTEDIEL